MPVTFRSAIVDDIDALLALQERYYAEDGYPFDRDIARQTMAVLIAEDRRGGIWVADEKGVVVAYVVLVIGYSLEFRGEDAFVDELYVSSNQRGRGIGTQGLKVVEQACRQRGVGVLHLEVERKKPDVQALYRRHGYVDHDRYLMSKALRAPGGARLGSETE